MTLLTMMLEFTDLATKASTPEDYISLYQSGEPPSQWKVWVARYIGTSPENYVARHCGMQLTPIPDVRLESPKCDTQVTTFVIGQLCIHTFCSTVITGADGEEYQLIDFPQLWPASGHDLDWAAARTIGDSGVDQLISLLRRAISPFHG
jgi:hypothetical protein